MSDESAVDASGAAPAGAGRKPLLIGLGAAVLLGGAGFSASYSGMIDLAKVADFGGGGAAAVDGHGSPPHGSVVFVPIQPILISLSGADTPRHLRFRAELETTPAERSAVEEIMPRILDVLNSYLRAVAIEDLERPTALIRLRAQMLRRVQLVAGNRGVRDLLVTEFVLN